MNEGIDEGLSLNVSANLNRGNKNPESLAPSHPAFDRSKILDSDFIELLIFENRELQASLDDIRAKLKSSGGTLDVPKPCEILPHGEEHNTNDQSIPQRSARREADTKLQMRPDQEGFAKGHMTQSVALIEDMSMIDVPSPTDRPGRFYGGLLLSPKIKHELSAAASNSRLPRQLSTLTSADSVVSPRGSILQNPCESPNSEHINTDVGLQLSLTNKSEDLHEDTRKPSVTSSYHSRVEPRNQNSRQLSFTSNEDQEVKSPMEMLNQSSSLKNDHQTTCHKNDKTLPPRTPETLISAIFKQPDTSVLEIASTDSIKGLESPLLTPNSMTFASNRSISDSTYNSTNSAYDTTFHHRPNTGTPGSSFRVEISDEEDVELFIRPKDFQTIKIIVVSTIGSVSRKLDEPCCTFSINDRESNKEMWRIRKSYTKLLRFDSEIRPVIEFFGLPPIPDRSIFVSTTPSKVVTRMALIQSYFDTIFVMPHIPQIVLERICRYISLDFVNPLDDFKSGAKKEGFLIRRYKGLGTAWKVRWCQIDGPFLEVYESPGGNLIEQIKLSGSQIGRQSSDVIAEERGYRHAFLILESSKSSKISGSYPKHFFCAESDLERDEWIAAMVEFTENDPLNTEDRPSNLQSISARSLQIPSGSYEALNSDGLKIPKSGMPYSDTNTRDEVSAALEEVSNKDAKRGKMRNLFPFRSKQALLDEGSAAESNSSRQVAIEPTMSTYLLQMNLSEEPAKSIFGRDLEAAASISSHEYRGLVIPSICYRCLIFLNQTDAIYEEGIFRLSGSASHIRQLKEKFNSLYDYDLITADPKPDIHTVSGLLKLYLRELPAPIFGELTYNELQKLFTTNSHLPKSELAWRLKDILRSPDFINSVYYHVCFAIFGFLKEVISKSSFNRMTLKNLCIVFVPTLNVSVEILSTCLVDFDCIFKDAPPTPDDAREILNIQIPMFS